MQSPRKAKLEKETVGNRVWVRQSAVDSVEKQSHPRQPTVHRRPSVNASSSSITSSSSEEASSIACRHATWGWKEGDLLESSGGQVIVRLKEQNPLHPEAAQRTVRLPANALTEGDVVLSNEFEMDENGVSRPPNDLITLTHLHEPAVVECLQLRYAAGQIYTNTGPVLLALNPFQTLRGVYGENIQKKYWEKAERNLQTELPPHVYAIADDSFRTMMRGLESLRIAESSSVVVNQSILVSGESGSGKTVTTKFVMKYLAALSQRSVVLNSPTARAYAKAKENRLEALQPLSPYSASKVARNARGFSQPSWAMNSGGKSKSNQNWRNKLNSQHSSADSSDLAAVTLLINGSSSNSIEAKVLQSNPILESFGNARTVRNDNSSRFGKFIEIQFSESGKLVGAQIETYLLEKVRLVTQNAGERNYHIFFELLSGAVSTDDLRQFYIASTARPEDFRISGGGTYDRRDGVSDRETFGALLSAMKTMKFSNEEIHHILSVVAAILHASNLRFKDLPHDCSELDKSNIHLDPLCCLLGINASDLNQALCYHSITAGKTTVKRSVSHTKADRGLEALMKGTYGALFTYLVKRINDSIAYGPPQDDDCESVSEAQPSEHPAASIGVLDIFGFESFTKNSFEQLCINYCNEALQQQFNAFVLKNEQAEYEREGIEWSFIEFPENQDVLDLIEKRGAGILSILDDQCRAPGPSDKAFAMNVYKNCTNLPRFSASRKQTASLQFAVHHYAGPVEYSTVGFTEKNRDELPKETVELLKNSSVPFIQTLATILETSHEDPPESQSVTPSIKKLHRTDSAVGRPTVAGQFRRQLRNLRNKINLTTPHYIRCLKPNDMLVPEHFDTAIVAEQLRCGGILEAVRVARAGFTQHFPHSDFVRRYRSIGWRELRKKELDVQASVNAGLGWNALSSKHVPYRNTYEQRSHRKPEPKKELSPAEMTALCRDLIKVLYRKIQIQDREDAGECVEIPEEQTPPAARAKTYTFALSTPTASWVSNSSKFTSSPSQLPPAHKYSSVRGRYTPWEKKVEVDRKDNSPGHSWKTTALKTADLGKVGIQMGKTKVFLRHNAFESLERIRSREQTVAATKLNAMFRRYLARIAYLPYRDAYRREARDRRTFFEDEFKESKEQDYAQDYCDDYGRGYSDRCSYPFRYRGSDVSVFGNASIGGYSLVDKWMESRIRDAIHNPVPRHQWGKAAPSSHSFKWVLSEGIWVKNYSFGGIAKST